MINKYILYLIVTLLVSLILIGPRIYYILTYERIVGRKDGVYREEVSTKTGSYIKTYPKIKFETKQDEVTFLAPSYMEEPYAGIDEIEVIYDKNNPENAYAYNFYGFWGPVFIYYLPFILVWTIIIFSADFIPKKINYKILEKRMFGR